MTESRGAVLPFYIAVDESASMTPYLGDLNESLRALHHVLLGEPMAASKVRICVIGFSDDAVERLPLSDPRGLDRMPALSSRAHTSYGAVFGWLVDRIPLDVARLKAEGYLVHRPAVFFMTDGQPNDDWKPLWIRLTDRGVTPAAPNIIACGIGTADASTIAAVATAPQFAFVSQAVLELNTAVAAFFSSLTHSVVASGYSLGSASPELIVDKPEGFTLAIDVI
ncbi:hypothetical protein [Streptomyces sp. NPDC001480]|uniref:vWA domain-containing protein n=1 Tax=Streptomyces sp. NPDC001480 TaxID=3364577 RepID=UPI0036A92D56